MTLELTKAGEQRAIEGTLATALRGDLGVTEDFPVFVPYFPYAKNDRRVSVLVEGYAFVCSGLPETRYFALESGPLVQKVLSAKGPHGMRILHTLPNYRVVEMQSQLRLLLSSDVTEGTQVRIMGGPYARLIGEVVDVYEDTVAVRFTLRSLDVIAFLERSLLNVNLEDDDLGDKVDPEGIESYEEHFGVH